MIHLRKCRDWANVKKIVRPKRVYSKLLYSNIYFLITPLYLQLNNNDFWFHILFHLFYDWSDAFNKSVLFPVFVADCDASLYCSDSTLYLRVVEGKNCRYEFKDGRAQAVVQGGAGPG